MKSLRRKQQFTDLKIVNKSEGLTLEIYDAIGADWWGGGITAQSVSDALKDSTGPVSVRINSPGGDAFEGIAIYNLLRSSGRQINVKVDGLAASAASIIAMAGDTREMGKGTMMMIHPAQMFAVGDAAIMRKAAEILDGLTTSIADIYVAHTNQKKAQIFEWVNAETWMDAAQALERGFSTATSEEEGNVKAVAAAFDLSVFKNTPEVLSKEPDIEPEIEELPIAQDDLYMLDIMRKRVEILRNA
jgi:ATP-dependent protease ClpP protease subunit